MICLDSDFIILFLKGDLDTISKLEQIISSTEVFGTTAINSFEIFVGIVAVDGITSKRINATRKFLDLLSIYNFTKPASERAAQIYNSLKIAGKQIGLKDTLVAAIALEENLTILTRNLKHFSKIPGLKIETW